MKTGEAHIHGPMTKEEKVVKEDTPSFSNLGDGHMPFGYCCSMSAVVSSDHDKFVRTSATFSAFYKMRHFILFGG